MKKLIHNRTQRPNRSAVKAQKILFINHEETRTGAPKILFEIAKASKDDFDVKMLSLKQGSMHKEFSNEFDEVLYHKKNGRKVLLRESPDLVYVNTIVGYKYAIQAKKLGIPVVLHIHELEKSFMQFVDKTDLSDFGNWADAFIAVSEEIRDFLVYKLNCENKKVIVIHEFVSLKEIIDKSKQKISDFKKTEETLIMCLGTVCKRKGGDIMFDTHKLIKKRGFDFQFAWIGPVFEEKEIQRSVEKRDKDFAILGDKANPFPYLNICDIFVLPSREDPFPLAALEAMALGKPIIAFKGSGGIPNIIDDCGIVVAEMNPEALADAIIELAGKKDWIESMGKIGAKKQKGSFDSSKSIPEIQRILKTIVAFRDISSHLITDHTELTHPMVSVVLPSFNYDWCISEAIESVLNQNYESWELIVVDDGSSDDSVKIIEKYTSKYPDKIKLFFHENKKNRGLSETYKLGISKCSGDFVAFIEADDIWYSDYISSKIPIFNKHQDTALVYNNLEMFGSKKIIRKRKKSVEHILEKIDKKNEPFFAYGYLLEQNYVPTFSCFMVRKEVLDEIEFSDKPLAWLDWFILAQISLRGKFYYQSDKKTGWRMHESSYDMNYCNELGDAHASKVDEIKNDILDYGIKYLDNRYLPELHRTILLQSKKILELQNKVDRMERSFLLRTYRMCRRIVGKVKSLVKGRKSKVWSKV